MRQRGTRNEGFFNNAKESGGAASLEALYKGARQSGSLNLSQKSLDAVPAVVYCLDAHAGEGEKFWEFNGVSDGFYLFDTSISDDLTADCPLSGTWPAFHHS